MTLATPAILINNVLPEKTILRDSIVVLSFAAFIALMARVSIPLPYVPITGQTLAIFLTALALGSRLGTLSVLAYLGYAALGLPVLAEGKPFFAAIVGPTAGFIVGFVISAFVLGLLADRGWSRSLPLAFTGMLIATVVLYTPGLLWLAKFVGMDTFKYGLQPFIIGDIIKAAFAALLLPFAWKIIGKH